MKRKVETPMPMYFSRDFMETAQKEGGANQDEKTDNSNA